MSLVNPMHVCKF